MEENKSDDIKYRIYDYTFYTDVEKLNKNEEKQKLLPPIHAFERYENAEFQPVQAITNTDSTY